MSEEDLQLLITLDDPLDAPEVDPFNHLQAQSTLEYWLGQQCQLDQRAEVTGDNDGNRVTFGHGDWTCTLSRLTGTTSVSKKGMNENVIEPRFEFEVCTVTQRKDGEIVEQKVFYDLVGMQKQFEVR